MVTLKEHIVVVKRSQNRIVQLQKEASVGSIINMKGKNNQFLVC